MKVSLNWLSDYVDVSLSAAELADLCMSIGFPVEEIEETDADIVLDLEVTSNRPDLLGHVGVARELATAMGAAFRPPVIGALPTSGKVQDLTGVEVLDPDLCPRYTARVIRNVKIGPSPRWMVERLEAVGLRSINNVVDVTNYVLMEYSQPLHSFDYDKLDEHRIVVRRAQAGESLVSIDGTKCNLDESMLIIADARKPVAIAGIMGGLDSEVGDATTSILLESARFDPLVTRRTSRKLQLMSDSNYRFERGVDPVGVDEASRRACQLILDLAGGELAEGVVDVWAQPWQPAKVRLRPKRTTQLLGLDIPADRQAEILGRLGLAPQRDGEDIVCTPPSYRPDLTREADLIEEVARMEGYGKIPVNTHVSHPVAPVGLREKARQHVREAVSGGGFDEAITPAFVDAAENGLFGFAESVCVDPLNRRSNNALRATLLPTLLQVCKTNQDVGNTDVGLYELAAVFPKGSGELPDERVHLGMATTRDLRDLRGTLEAVVQRTDPRTSLTVRPADVPGFESGAAGEILLDGAVVGVIGQIASKVLDAYGIERPVAAAEVRFEALLAGADAPRTYTPVPKFPPVVRDLSVLVDEDVTWHRLESELLAVEQPLRVSMDYVTTFRGKPISEGRKSVTVRLTYRSPGGTLRGEQVDLEIEQILTHLRKTLNAELRA